MTARSEYVLGVDLGTTFTAAATCVAGASPQMIALGSEGYTVPSVLFLRSDGTFLAGETAELRSSADPTRVARHFKRRLGDEIPVRLAGIPFAPQVLVTRLLEWVYQQVVDRQGGAPVRTVLTHPANWGPYRCELLQQAATMASIEGVELVSEPEAAAIHYVQTERVERGELIGVYDLGGGTFDAVVMRRAEAGFEVLGRPSGVERLGGLDFDDVIRSYVIESADIGSLEQTDDVVAAGYALQASCVAAKRVLSADTVADVRVAFPGLSTSVRITRSEFEDRIRPRLIETLSAFDGAVQSAGIDAASLSRILLVGGSSRIPVVAELLAQRFGRPIAVDSDPKNTVALGSALYGAGLPPTPVAPPLRPSSPEPETLPSVEPATARSVEPAETEAPEQVGDDNDLLDVAAESRHRPRIPQPTAPTLPSPAAPTEAQAVKVDPRLIGLAVVLVLVLVAFLVWQGLS